MISIRSLLLISVCSCVLHGQTISTSQFNNQRTAANTNETTLTQLNVSGLVKQGSFAVDGAVYAQPLIIDGVNIGGATSILIVATVYDGTAGDGGSIYAFNANQPGMPAIWHDKLVAAPAVSTAAADGCLATPVVDTVNGIVYAVCQDNTYTLWLFALNLADGTAYQPATTVACTDRGVTMNSGVEAIRTGLLLYGGQLYFGSSAGGGGGELVDGTRGWVFEYNAATLQRTNCMTVVPNWQSGLGGAGVWQAGAGFAVDSDGNVRFATGNGVWNGPTANYGESIMKVSPDLTVLDYFTPADWQKLNGGDTDQDSGAIMAVGTHIFQWGKSGILWVDPGGGLNGATGSAAQNWNTGLEGGAYSGVVIGSMAFANNTLYLSGSNLATAPIQSYSWNGSTFNTTPVAVSVGAYPRAGARLSYSSNGSVANTELLWAITPALPLSGYTVPGTLRAYNASTLAELWNSDMNSNNAMGYASQFVQPTIADGRIYVPTASRAVVVYGLGTLATPTVTFTGAPSSAPYNSTFTVSATTNASTTAAITASGPCSVSGNTVTMTGGTGTCLLTATWAADSNYNGAAANQSTTATKISPTVTFTGAPSSAPYNSTFTVSATTNASTTAAITASGPCSVSGNTTTMTGGTGTCLLTATWAADNNYTTVSAGQSTTATKISPTVTFTGAPASAPANSMFVVSATTNASTTATITASGACSVSGSTVTMITSTGTCSLTASWLADNNYIAATASQSTTATSGVSSPQTWPNGYTYKATFTVGAAEVPSAQTNFPVLISGTFADFATTANGGRISNSCTQTVGNNAKLVPCDLIFTSDAAGAMPLNWEFESYSATTGAAIIWVNAPNLSNGSVIYGWYGQPAVTTLQSTPSAAWSSNFEAVYHLDENPTGAAPQFNDSTANGNNATINGTVLASQQQPGEIGGGINFEGDTWAGIANASNFNFDRNNAFSISGWFKLNNANGTLLSKILTVSPGTGWALLQFSGAQNPTLAFVLTGTGYAMGETPAVTSGVWHYVVVTYSGTSTVAGIDIYIDGVSQKLTVPGNNLTASILNAATPEIAGRNGANNLTTDSVDELRISTIGVTYPASWVTASYNNQSQPATFFSVVTGLTNAVAVTPVANVAPASITFPNQTVSTTSTAQAITVTNSGTGPLTISSIAVTGTNPGDFAQTNNCPLSPATIAPGGSCTISVTFTPQAANPRLAAITIADNASGSPQSVGLSGTGLPALGAPWPNGYTYKATFTVGAAEVPSAQTNFPVLISGTFADFATTANGGRISNTCTQTVGNNAKLVPCDLIFTSDAAGAMPLNWEFESYSATTGAAIIWVNAPNLSNGSVIYGWYGQPAVTTLQTTPSAAWSSNFEAVYHLDENPTGAAPQFNDSTANGNNATINGTVLASQQQPGEIGGGINFEGDTWAGIANASNFNFDRNDAFSIAGWFKLTNANGTLLSKILVVSPGTGWALLQFSGAQNPTLAFVLTGTGYAMGETPAVTSGVWHYVVVTYSGTSTVAGIQIYIDGVSQKLSAPSNNLTASILNAATPEIAGRNGANNLTTDSVDELRISTIGVTYPASWVTASYNNQSQPTTFFSVVTGLTN